jgi:hypothetical protein
VIALELNEKVLTEVPMPLITTGMTLPEMDEVFTFRVTFLVPAVVGAKVTVIAHPSPDAIVAVQVEVALYEPSLPTNCTPLKATGTVPLEWMTKVLENDWLPA